MQILLVDEDPNFRRVLESVLSNGGIRVTGLGKPVAALRSLSERQFRLALVNLPPQCEDIDAFLGDLRSDTNGSTLPVVLMSESHQKQSAIVKRLMKTHQIQNFLPRPFEMFSIAGELKRIADAGGPTAPTPKPALARGARRRPPGREKRRPTFSRESFRLVADIWLQKKTGVLRKEQQSHWVIVCNGGLREHTDLSWVEEALASNGLSFQATHQDANTDSRPLGQLLWRVAQENVPVSFEVQLERKALALTPRVQRTEELSLSAATQKVIRSTDGHIAIGDLLRSLELNPGSVARQLGALKTLGIIELVDLATPRPTGQAAKVHSHAPRAMAPERKQPARPAPGKEQPTAQQIMKRLQSEHERLKGADPFTILGLASDAPDSDIRNTADRMTQRYQRIANDNELPRAVCRMGGLLLALTQNAERRILNDREQREEEVLPPPTPKAIQYADETTEELAFSEGKKAFSTGDFKRAVQCFRKARNERIDSVRNLAWLGWAIFHNADQPQDERTEDALDMLRLASSFDTTHRQGQFFLAYVEFKTGEIEQATTRLGVLVKRYADHVEAKKLLRMIQAKHKKK